MDRTVILDKVREAVGPSGIGRFCFVCGKPGVQVEETLEGQAFICVAAGHRSPRAYIFDGRAAYTFQGSDLVHEVVAALIQRNSGAGRQTLLFLRSRFPYLYTIPAGHLEVGMDPEIEMRRETKEETDLEITSVIRLWPAETLLLSDPCRRGADLHRWHVFQVTTEGSPRLSEEARILGWYADTEIRSLAMEQKLVAPVQQILARSGVL
jgi:ADP-ribose pyrophosphatase YjhB (NUDIX family)